VRVARTVARQSVRQAQGRQKRAQAGMGQVAGCGGCGVRCGKPGMVVGEVGRRGRGRAV